MLDVNVLVAGILWPRWQYEILRHALIADFQLVLAPLIIDATERHIIRINPTQRSRFASFSSTVAMKRSTTRLVKRSRRTSILVRDKG